MTDEQYLHMMENHIEFSKKYTDKYENGAKEHGGVMWRMGAYQALQNMEDEILDQWSYARQIRKCLDEIQDICESNSISKLKIAKIRKILNRVKKDD